MRPPRSRLTSSHSDRLLDRGGAFGLVGALGFVPGITTDYDRLSFAGPHSGALLLGVFAASVLHNLVHLLFGVAGLTMATTPRRARTFLIYGGTVYAALWIYGLYAVLAAAANVVPVNTADNWLHLGLAVVMIAADAGLGRGLTRHGIPAT